MSFNKFLEGKAFLFSSVCQFIKQGVGIIGVSITEAITLIVVT
jgi:hypothetical protein